MLTIRAMRIHHQRHEQPLDGGWIVRDLVIGIAADLGGVFQSVQRRLASERRAIGSLRCQCATKHADDGVVPQLVVIDDIFVAESNAENALAEHRWNLVTTNVGLRAS